MVYFVIAIVKELQESEGQRLLKKTTKTINQIIDKGDILQLTFFYRDKINIAKFTILTIFKYTVQWH